MPSRLPRRWFDAILDVLAVAGIVAVLVFPAAAVASVASPPKIADPAIALPPLRRSPAGKGLRDVPVLTAAADVEAQVEDGRLPDALTEQSQIVFGASGGPELLAIASSRDTKPASTAYPFGHPEVDELLDRTPDGGAMPAAKVAAVNALAGLLVLAAVNDSDAFPNAAPVAYALYDRARQADACDPQLNLAFLVSTDMARPTDATVTEFERAARDCPGDPTPLWLLGQWESVQQANDERALKTFKQLEHRVPGSALGWSGEADTLVRDAYRVDVPEPFTAQADFRRAKALYQRAENLDPREPGLLAGEARALAGLSDVEGAVTKQRGATNLARQLGVDPAAFRGRLVTYLERAGRFAPAAEAEAAARAPDAAAVPPVGPGLIARGADHADEVSSEGALGPISVGAVPLRPVTFTLSGPPPALGFTGGVLDISFIPQFRAVPSVTVGPAVASEGAEDSDGSCRARRDRLLAGRTSESHADGPTQCDSSLLRSVEQFEAGDLHGAIAGLDPGSIGDFSLQYSIDGNPRQAAILDADQNLWRSAAALEEAARHPEQAADNLKQAARAAALLTKVEVADPKGPDRAGEIAYLQKHYRAAAGFFEAASKRATGETLATELLKQGTALEMAGDGAGARPTLRDASAGLPTMSCAPSAPAILAPGASITCTGKRTVTEADATAGDVGNTAIIAGLDPANNPVFGSISSMGATGTTDGYPSLSYSPTDAPSAGTVAGTVVTHTVTARNTGTVTLHSVGASELGDQALLDAYNVQLQAGDAALRNRTVLEADDATARDGKLREAEAHYEAARQTEALLRGRGVPGFITSRREELFRPEVLENNEALVLVELGKKTAALEAVEAAVALDPMNPIFLANEGYVQEQLGHLAAAAKAYRAALESDPTSFQAANNLGVILGNEGRLSAAAGLFRQALAAHREYATAAFNLGLVLDRMGPSHILESQGELAVATRQDPELRERDHELISDDDIVFTTLDLSKPLPPDWHFATSQQRTPITVASIVFALLLFRLIKTVVQERMSESVTERGLRASTRRLSARADDFGRRIPGAVALVAVVGVFAYPLARSSSATRSDFLLVGLGVSVAALAFMRLRSAIARRSAVRTRHYPCIPAVVVGGAAALVGLGFAPMPATASDDPLPRHARWWGTGLLGALTVVLLVVGRFTAVPFATQLGVVCLVMTSSALIPVEPYDGVLLDEGHRGLLIAIAVALAAIGALLELGVL